MIAIDHAADQLHVVLMRSIKLALGNEYDYITN